MKKIIQSIEQVAILKYSLKWSLLVLPVALFAGSVVALFLFLLDLATKFRWQHEWLLYFLPFAGIAIVWAYHSKGKNTSAGNNLIMDEIHKPGEEFRYVWLRLYLLLRLLHLLVGRQVEERYCCSD